MRESMAAFAAIGRSPIHILCLKNGCAQDDASGKKPEL
jgi:hypothetical protein